MPRSPLPRIGILLALFLAGCIDDAPSATDDLLDVTALSTSAGTDVAAVLLDVIEPAQYTYYLTEGHGLSLELPAAGSEPVAYTWRSCVTARPCTTNDFFDTPLTRPGWILAEEVTFDIWVESDAPVAGPGVFDFAAWLGHGTSFGISQAYNPGTAVTPGAPVNLKWTFDFAGREPIYFRSGEQLTFLFLSATSHEGSGVLRILYGGETPSSVSFTADLVDTDWSTQGTLASKTQTGVIPNAGLTSPQGGGEGDTFATHEFTVGPNTSYLRVALEFTGGTMDKPDMDLHIYAGDKDIGGSFTPRSDESWELASPFVDVYRGQTLTAQVANFFGRDSAYDLVVEMN